MKFKVKKKIKITIIILLMFVFLAKIFNNSEINNFIRKARYYLHNLNNEEKLRIVAKGSNILQIVPSLKDSMILDKEGVVWIRGDIQDYKLKSIKGKNGKFVAVNINEKIKKIDHDIIGGYFALSENGNIWVFGKVWKNTCSLIDQNKPFIKYNRKEKYFVNIYKPIKLNIENVEDFAIEFDYIAYVGKDGKVYFTGDLSNIGMSKERDIRYNYCISGFKNIKKIYFITTVPRRLIAIDSMGDVFIFKSDAWRDDISERENRIIKINNARYIKSIKIYDSQLNVVRDMYNNNYFWHDDEQDKYIELTYSDITKHIIKFDGDNVDMLDNTVFGHYHKTSQIKYKYKDDLDHISRVVKNIKDIKIRKIYCGKLSTPVLILDENNNLWGLM